MSRIGFGIVAVLAGLWALLGVTVLARESDVIHWETDLSAARLAAAEKGRPLMVVFR